MILSKMIAMLLRELQAETYSEVSSHSNSQKAVVRQYDEEQLLYQVEQWDCQAKT